MMPPRKGVAILGSTGSIGTSTLALIARFEDRFRVVALAAGRRVAELKEQIERFAPDLVSVSDPRDAAELKRSLGARAPIISSGAEGLRTVATATGADVVVAGLVGAVGLEPTLAAIDAGREIALANKEVMVVAGELVRRRAAESGALLLPVDSEHNAVFQALQGRRPEHLRRVVLTASGGPFRTYTSEQLAVATPEQALRHPTWAMGAKITIDSATLMNKGLEVIEARWLFDLEPDQIGVVVHPQSIVHSLVEYRDGSVVSVMALPDMTIPIGFALSYPDVLDLDYLPRLDLAATAALTFEDPDPVRFPCLGLAYRALQAGGAMPAVLNAANEVAVERFLARDVGFQDIPRILAAVMAAHRGGPCDNVADLLACDARAREHAAGFETRREAAHA
ncbi:MAG TPA: 1-deoxy-D-xylulose-5-phosphate reductoisomerase [Candidatus Binatia bacterium]|nr:1-deoxy-D-xylulose-5-phosphate reductoisomerase [Candidatus Binatia bacterium]